MMSRTSAENRGVAGSSPALATLFARSGAPPAAMFRVEPCRSLRLRMRSRLVALALAVALVAAAAAGSATDGVPVGSPGAIKAAFVHGPGPWTVPVVGG